MDEVECVVVGAGVIGLAAARALALAGREVLVLDRAWTIGFETSSRNSEVIHSGIYYPKGSLKATTCVAGRRRLYAYCREHGVAHAQLGKLIVAAEEGEIPGARTDRRRGAGQRRRRRRMARRVAGAAPRTGSSVASPRCCRRRPGSSTAMR